MVSELVPPPIPEGVYLALCAVIGSLTRPAPHFAAANGEGVSLCLFDDATGALERIGAPLRLEDSTWLVAAPAQQRVYAVTDCDDGRQSAVAALSVNAAEGVLTLISTQPAGGSDGCHASLSSDKAALFVANYGGHRTTGPDFGVAIVPLDATGVEPASIRLRHEGHGPNTARQESPHAHCVLPSPDGRFLFVADLGIDQLVAYALDGAQPVRRPALDVSFPAGLGPRHFLFSADGRFVYVVSELIPTVVALSYDGATGVMRELASIAIPAPAGGALQPAGIVVHPDGRHLFVSLRLSEEILVLAIDPATGIPAISSRHDAGGRTPRDLTVSPSGRHLLVANQDSDCVSVFAIDPASAALSGPVSRLAIGTPMAVTLANFA